ncbi:MAG: hypothetical protein GX346_00435 [Clostridiales bacterium]|nr:hypothetical protein [Clostridiales bacterium]
MSCLNYNDEILVDYDDAMMRLMNDESLYHKWLNDFFNSKIINEIVFITKCGDFDEIHKSLHHLKGVSANLSLNRLAAYARYLDEFAKSKSELNKIIEGVDTLKNIFIKTHEFCIKKNYCE